MFEIGISTGLRVSDILRITAGTARKGNFVIKEKKTGKERSIIFSERMFKAVMQHISYYGLKDNDYIVFSTTRKRNKALSRVQAYKIMRKVAVALKIENTGSHGMRKTYARRLFLETKSIELVQQELNHKYMTTTLLYLFDDFSVFSNLY